jgi:hypothetical protein
VEQEVVVDVLADANVVDVVVVVVGTKTIVVGSKESGRPLVRSSIEVDMLTFFTTRQQIFL